MTLPGISKRLVYQYDPSILFSKNYLNYDLDEFVEYGFDVYDHPNSQIGSIWWDCAFGNHAIYPSDVLPPNPYEPFSRWLSDGFDIVKFFVENSKKRNLETFWNFRVSEVDVGVKGKDIDLKTGEYSKVNPVKAKHPDWLLKTWWPFGLWNYSVPELREFRANIIFELAENYDFDGFQIDFARHIPVLPVGRQWELREGVTDFMRKVRNGLDKIGERKKKKFKICARVNRDPEGSKVDGLDVRTWTDEKLVDILTLGSRSFDVDFNGWRERIGDSKVKLFSCIDVGHFTDGYRLAPIDVLRGVSDNFWYEGADGIVLFNWGSTSPENMKKLDVSYKGKPITGSTDQFQAVMEIGSRNTMKGKRKTFPVERRGNSIMGHYRWREGALNGNEHAQLPLKLRWDGTPALVDIKTSDDVENLRDVSLVLIISNSLDGDSFFVSFNGKKLDEWHYEYGVEDEKMAAPSPDLLSGPVLKDSRLLKLSFSVPANLINAPLNQIGLGIEKLTYNRGTCQEVFWEKAELTFNYCK